MRAGEEYVPPALPALTLTVGNAAGIIIVRDGKAGKPLGAPAEVVRGVKLTPKANR
jgi:cytoskeleton protein RodZ